MSETDDLDLALERLLRGESPRTEAPRLDDEQQRMLRMAQILRGSVNQEPDPDFVESVRASMPRRDRRVSRRTAFLSGIGTLAAGLLAGVGIDRAVNSSGQSTPSQALVGPKGKWVRVAAVADVPHGAIRPFSTGALQGFVVNRNGRYRALSRICTHMGCRLNWDKQEQVLLCPCHGAEFDLNGQNRYGPGGYNQSLPQLPEISVRVKGEALEVWTA